MSAAGQDMEPAAGARDETTAFSLDGIRWESPDSMELRGAFSGGDTPPLADASLVVAGERSHILPVVDQELTPSGDGARLWRAVFAWRDVPELFDSADLWFGAERRVRLDAINAPTEERPPAIVELVDRRPQTAPADGEGRDGFVGRSILAEDAEGIVHRAAHHLAQQQLEDLRSAFRRAVSSRDDLRQELETVHAARERDLAELRVEVERLTTIAEHAVTEERRARLGVSRQLEEVEASLAAERAEAQRLRERLAQLERLPAELEVLRAEADEARVLAEEMQRERREAFERLNRIEQILDQDTR